MHPEDLKDFERARFGDRQAFGRLVQRHWPALVQWLYGMVGCAHSAEDLAQEAFLKAWDHLPEVQSAAAWRTWLFRVANNAMVDFTRRHRPGGDEGLWSLADRGPGPVAAAIGQETARLLAESLPRLPAEFRAALLLWTQQGLTYKEIADALDVTEVTARWRVFKARHLLLTQMQRAEGVRAS